MTLDTQALAQFPKETRKLIPKARHACQRHAVLVYRGSNIIARGFNHDEIHAEVAALKKLWPKERKNTTVISVRMTRGGNLGMAKPCANCEGYMRDNGVKTVIYSNEQGEMIRMRLNGKS